MRLNFSNGIKLKLQQKHNVTTTEVQECFDNREKGLLEDTREQNKTDPATQWFIAMTDHGRKLKVVFITLANGICNINTAYEPNDVEVKIYEKHA